MELDGKEDINPGGKRGEEEKAGPGDEEGKTGDADCLATAGDANNLRRLDDGPSLTGFRGYSRLVAGWAN